MGDRVSTARHRHDLALECLIRAKLINDPEVRQLYHNVGKLFLARAYVALARKRKSVQPKTDLQRPCASAIPRNYGANKPKCKAANDRSTRTKCATTWPSGRRSLLANDDLTSSAHAHRHMGPVPARGPVRHTLSNHAASSMTSSQG
jgi:hypothetical protein